MNLRIINNIHSAVVVRAVVFFWFIVMSFFSPYFGVNSSSAAVFDEAQVKAVFLYNLTKFVTWPPEPRAGEDQSFCIAMVGTDDAFYSYLKKTVRDENVKGKSIAVKRFESLAKVQWDDVDLLFISEQFLSSLGDYRSAIEHNQILTVADTEGFCSSGGMINLLKEGRRVKIEINIEAVKKAKLRISAQVLKLAKLVKTALERHK